MQGEGFVMQGRERRPSRRQAQILLFTAMLGLFVCSFFIGFLRALNQRLGIEHGELFYTAAMSVIYYTLFIILPAGLFAIRQPGLGENIRFKPLGGRAAFLIVLCAPFGVLFSTYANALWLTLIEALGGVIPPSPSVHAGSIAELIGLICVSAILPAVCEELLFRGMLLSAWEEKGSIRAMLIVTVWFTMMHGSIESIPAQFIGGLIMAFLVICTDSLFAGIVYHTVYNALVLIINNASNDTEAVTGSYYEALGGASGMVSVVLLGLIMGGMLFFLLRRLYKGYCAKGFGFAPAKARKCAVSEYVIILCCAALGLMLYAMNLAEILGVTG
ncbi:MAG: CPBP family intramembrane metalloprotease [Clostridia bacterium]|nr:CPBP family intramembrane metalloprotease [Clostridia bacterium]